MPSWVPSWFTFPKFDVAIIPNLQRKFFSFILKRFLGHLLQPGQLDVEQIDSAIGSGNLTINDLKLECTSINNLLSGLPIQLHDGGIASVSARIPWPNPLTNGVELSVRSLDLVFHLLPRVANDVPSPSTNLADSISEAAQLFSHEEITQEESTEAHQAFQSSGTSHLSKNDDYVPGGLDTPTDEHEVISDVDPTGISMFASMFEYLLSQFTFSAKDISITVIHPGHSSFRFKVSELRFGRPTSDCGGTTRTVSISGVEIAHRDLGTSQSPSSGHSESRSLRTSQSKTDAPSHRVDNAATVTLPSSLTPSSSLEGSNQPLPSVDSSTSEDSSRPGSPSGSTTSSLFQSALTTQGFKLTPRECEDTVDSQEIGADDMERNSSSAMVGGCLLSQTHETMEDGLFHRVIASLAMEPIVIHITTSAPPVSSSPSVQTQSDTHTSGSDPSGPDSLQPNLEISVSVGIVACALAAPQISAILEVISVTDSYSSPSIQPPVSNKPSVVVPPLSLLDQANLAIQIRGFVLLLQSVPTPLTSSSHDVPLADFFTHPLTPPKTDHNYVRFLIDRLKADLSVSTTLEQVMDEPTLSPEHLPERSRVPWVVRGTTSSHFTFSVDDLSAFAFCIPGKETIPPASHEAFVLPIVLTDPLLFTQYRPEHQPPPNIEHHLNVSPEFIRKAVPVLPEFEVLDWTSENNRTSQVKLSLWRVRPPPGYRRSQRDHTNDSPISPPVASSPKTISGATSANKPQVALSGQVSLSTPKDSGMDGSPESTCSVQVYITPLHVFVDMEGIAAASDFLETLSVPRSNSGSFEPKGEDREGARRHPSGGDLTPLSSTQRTTLQRIRRQELEDLNLSVDYLSKDPVSEELSPGLRKVQRGTEDQSHRDRRTEFDINFLMVRVQIRCPSPPSLLQRSGAAILDVHHLKLTSSSSLRTGEIYPSRVESEAESTGRDSSSRNDHLLTAECRTLLLACSPAEAETARGFCSIGPLSPATDSEVSAFHDHIRFQGDTSPIRRSSFVKLSQNRQNSRRPAALVAEIDIPSIVLNLSKPLFDSLQFWIDDVTQLLERTMAHSSDTLNLSRNPSLVGSRFFSGSKQGSVEIAADETSPDNIRSSTESIIKVTISEASMRLLIPRNEEESHPIEPFDVFVSDVDVLLESKPEGKDETVVTLSVVGITVNDAANPFPYPTLSLATPRRLFSTPKPVIKLQFSSIALPEHNSKESRIKLGLHGFTLNVFPSVKRIGELVSFAKPPPGVFESVVPSERTRITVKIAEGSARLFAPHHTGALVLHLGDVDLSTEVVGDSREIPLRIAGRALTSLFIDNHLEAVQDSNNRSQPDVQGPLYWKKRLGYALISDVSDIALTLRRFNEPESTAQSEITIDRVTIRIHLCADTGSSLGLYFGDLGTALEAEGSQPNIPSEPLPRRPTVVSAQQSSPGELTYSIDQHAFQSIPEVGAAPDMIYDDLPSNPDYLDVSFGAAAGLRELGDDDDLDMDDSSQSKQMGSANLPSYPADKGVISSVGGETIKLLDPSGLHPVENFFNTLPALVETSPKLADQLDRIVVREGDIKLFLYEGYDWVTTRKVIEDEVKKMKRRLTRIKQLVADGQAYDPNIDPTNTFLFNSIHVGLDQDADEMEPDALIAAIDEQLREDNDTASVSSWQSLRPTPSGRPNVPHPRLHGRRLTRSRSPSIEIHLSGLFIETLKFVPNDKIVSRTFATVKDVEILDHVKTSTWRKFLTALRSDSRGNIRETGSDMVRIELRGVHPVPGNTLEETRLRVKILPLRLHVDQDALDFLKKFFTFQNPNMPSEPEPKTETYLQRAEVYPVVLKLDYKPRRVDYRALREGRTIELMNFFHFDGAEMTLRHLTLFGVAGWPRFFDMMNDLWTPDVKATQLADVVSGVSPIRSVVNVGSGVADLVLLPIAQYRKDGRVVRGLQKGTKSFVRSTAIEAVKLGAQLATGTQVILEQAENVLGSKFNETILAETVPHLPEDAIDTGFHDSASDEETTDPISRYAEQPVDIREGIQSAYTSMRRNLSSAAQTILAVPMEVFERSGSEGPVRAVIRAVPIAVLRPMIGASEAVSKTLLGLHNTMDPEIRHENAAKYKHR